MPRVIGIDLGTVTVDLCGIENELEGRLEESHVFLARSLPTSEVSADPASLLDLVSAHAPLDLVVGPSGYGLPLIRAVDLLGDDIQLASLAVDGEGGGIGGFRRLLHACIGSALPIVFTPGVIHLATVPPHRKVNRVDMGTADKVCAVALAIAQEARRTRRPVDAVSFLFLELGGAFSAAIAVQDGRIVDGAGGTSGPMGQQAAGALDGEVAFLAGQMTKTLLFRGGAQSLDPDDATDAFVESAAKAVAAMAVSAPGVTTLVLSGRLADDEPLRAALTARLRPLLGDLTVVRLDGFAPGLKQGAQGAALVADGLAGGAHAALVDRLGLRDAWGTVLDHLRIIDPADARRRLGLAS